MFLSAFVSHYQPDGTLSVDLRDQGGPIVGYGPFAAGMPWFRRKGGGWVDTAYDWGARLVNPAHESRQDLPVLRYLEPWPRDFIRALHPVWYAQSAAMQVCARYPAARDLARSNLVLLWIAAARYTEDAGWHARLPELLRLSQRELLAAALDLPDVRPVQVRLLRKIVLREGTRRVLEDIRDLAADLDAVMAFRHWPRLPSSLVPLGRGRLLRHLHWLRDQLAATQNHWLLNQILEGRIALLVDTSRLLEEYPRNRTDRFVHQFCRDWSGVQRAHDGLMLLCGEQHASDLDPALSLGPPPIPPDDRFQAVTTVGELQEEGKTMRHCVATRASDILAGECYVYRVKVCGEHGTLQIGIKPHGLVIDEFRLRRNADPSPAAWAAARAWLARNSGDQAVQSGEKDAGYPSPI
jgi:hypothetical protein